MDVQSCLAVIDSMNEGRLPDGDRLAAFIDACAPQMFSGPVPEDADGMRSAFLAEAGLKSDPRIEYGRTE